jgi:hypothetical protein
MPGITRPSDSILGGDSENSHRRRNRRSPPLAQSHDAKSGKIELPNKLGAMQLLAKMCGWNEPEKHELEHGYKAQQDLVEVIARLRGRGAVRNNQGDKFWAIWRRHLSRRVLALRWQQALRCCFLRNRVPCVLNAPFPLRIIFVDKGDKKLLAADV